MPIKLTENHRVGRGIREVLANFVLTIPDGMAYTIQEVGEKLGHRPDIIRRTAKELDAYMIVHSPAQGQMCVVANQKTIKEKLDANRAK